MKKKPDPAQVHEVDEEEGAVPIAGEEEAGNDVGGVSIGRSKWCRGAANAGRRNEWCMREAKGVESS